MSESRFLNDNPLVTIAIPTYNSEATIVNTLKSIITQTYVNLEIIVIDNNSNDETINKIKEIKDERIKLIINPVNIGAEANFNKCVLEAQGQYIGIFHSDDIYDKYIVEKEISILKNDNKIGAVFTIRYDINEDGNIIKKRALPDEVVEKKMMFPELINYLLCYGQILTCPSAIVRSCEYKLNLPFNYKLFGVASDLAMWLKISKSSSIYIINEPLMYYRHSKTHVTYTYEFKRTKVSDFYSMIDFFIENEEKITINNKNYEKYNIHKKSDMLSCNLNKILLNSKENLYKIQINYAKLRLLKIKPFFYYFFRFFLYDTFKDTVYIRFIALLLKKIE